MYDKYKPLRLINIQYSDINIYITELNTEEKIESIQALIGYCFVDDTERHAIGSCPHLLAPLFDWDICEENLSFSENQQTFTICHHFNHKYNLFIISFRLKNNTYYPIETIRIYANETLLIDTTGNIQLIEMAQNNQIVDKFIYTISYDEGIINFSKINVIKFEITINNNMKQIESGKIFIHARKKCNIIYESGFIKYSNN